MKNNTPIKQDIWIAVVWKISNHPVSVGRLKFKKAGMIGVGGLDTYNSKYIKFMECKIIIK